MSALTERLATLQTRVLDAAIGHAEGARLAEDPTMERIFQEMHAMHETAASVLAAALVARGVEPDADGSFLQYVHKAILDVRAAVGALGEGAIPGVLDGEKRILELYDATLQEAEAAADTDLVAILGPQRDQLSQAIDRLSALEATSG